MCQQRQERSARDCIARVFVVCGVLGLAGLLMPGVAVAQVTPLAHCVGTDFVGVAVAKDMVALATAARTIARDKAVPYLFGPRGQQWRFRIVPVASEKAEVQTFKINRFGTSATVVFRERPAQRIDLTRDILELASDQRLEPPVVIEGDAPVPCAMNSQRLDNFDQQFLDVMKTRAAGAPGNVQGLQWTFYAVEADARLYAPVLQLSRQEAIVPEDFQIWDRLNAGAAKDFRDRLSADRKRGTDRSRALKQTYVRYRELFPSAPASVYFRELSVPGSWVFEYWFYYPIDEGGLDEHLHDSEHMFVEVDKLGGIVRRVVGAGHGLWAPNNEFGTFVPSVPPVTLPLWALVEQGKHATAPDIDHDGRFVPGIDTNLYRDVGKAWGIRDATGGTDSAFRAFEAAMASGRADAEGIVRPWWRADRVTKLNGTDDEDARDAGYCKVVEGRPDCYVLRQAPTETIAKCSEPTANCAASQIVGHDDFMKPYLVLKQGYYPAFALRAGAAFTPTKKYDCRKMSCSAVQHLATEQSLRYSLGGAMEISSIPFGRGQRLPLAGRIGIDALLDSNDLFRAGWFDGIAGRYEMTLSNLLSAYGGATWQIDELDAAVTKDEANPAWWFTGGLAFERPIYSRILGSVRFGAAYSNVYGVRWDVRVTTGFALGTPHRRFGIVRRASNPFSH